MDKAYEDLLKRLKEERQRLCLTQKEMGRFARMSQSNYSKIEQGSRRLSFYELNYLCDSNIDIHYIFTGRRCSDKYMEVFFRYSYAELLCFLNIIISVAELRYANDASEQWRQVFELHELSRLAEREQRFHRNVFLSLRHAMGYSQRVMASKLGVDIKKLRELENGRSLPDSELTYRLYQQFHVSPAVILKDKKGLASEIGCMLEMMETQSGEDMSRFVKSLQHIS